jgi:YebC/PmpR family DNA-binding regulatory protein
MAGHNKWTNIKNRKGAQDKKKSRDFFVVAKMIRTAIKKNNDGNPDTNPNLRLALEKARAVSMPKENVARAINRALGKGETGQSIQDVLYEAYGPGGAAILIVAVTDNVQRTAANIRYILSRNGGTLGSPGSAAFLFTRGDDLSYTPNMVLPLSESDSQQLGDLIALLEDDEDVEEVYASAEWEVSEA